MKVNETIYAGEAQFAGWGDSHTGGPIIKLRLPSAEHLDKFRALTVAKGNQAGHLFQIAIVEQGEEGEPVPPPEPTKRADGNQAKAGCHKEKVGPYCIEAVDLCKNELFRRWLESEAGVPVRNAEQAKQGMLAILGLSSRKEIDHSDEAKDAFVENIRVPFLHWQREQVEGDKK